MINKYVILFIALICMIGTVFALPTTTAATDVNSNGATLHMTGGVAPMYYQFGGNSNTQIWYTPNSSSSNATIYGSPITGSTLYYFKACDATGCGNTLSFTTSAITPQPTTTFGAAFDNITKDPTDLDTVSGASIASYFWLTPTFPSIVWAMIFMGIYLGLWLRERDLVVPVILGLITGSFVMFSDAGLNLGIPVEFQAMAQGLTYAALAGIILSWVKRS